MARPELQPGLQVRIAVALLLVPLASITGCEAPAPPTASMRIAVVTAGSDAAVWQRGAAGGVARLADELGATVVRRHLDRRGDLRTELRALAQRDVELVLCVGRDLDDDVFVESMAAPEVHFVLLPGAARGRNVSGSSFNVASAAYVAGVMAATVGGRQIGLLGQPGPPWLERVSAGFVTGARRVEPAARMIAHTGPDGARALAAAGVKVALYAAETADPVVLAGAREAGLLLVLTDPAPPAGAELVVATVAMDVAEAMVRLALAHRNGESAGRTHRFELGSGVVRVLPGAAWDRLAGDAARAAAGEARADVDAGIVEIEQMGM